MESKVVSHVDGKTANIKFDDVAQDGQMSTDFFGQYSQDHPEIANLVVEFGDGSFEDIESMEFALARAEKTLGTYVTRCNKVANGDDPTARESRSGSAGSSSKANIGVEKVDAKNVHLFEVGGDAFADVSIGGTVSTNNFEAMAYWVEAILNPAKHANRINKLRQFENGIEAAPPEYVLTYEGVTINMGSKEPDEDATRKAQGEIAVKLFMEQKVFDVKKLQNAKPEMTGGGSEWLAGWLEAAFPAE